CGPGRSGTGNARTSRRRSRIPRQWRAAPRRPSAPSGTWLGSRPPPAHALRRVLEQDAFAGQLVADGIGAGEVTRLLRGIAFVDQGLDAGGVGAVGAVASEPCGRSLLQ